MTLTKKPQLLRPAGKSNIFKFFLELKSTFVPMLLRFFIFSLIIGFSAGQIQLIDPFQKDFQISRLFNEDRFIDKSPVTCLKWVPGKVKYQNYRL